MSSKVLVDMSSERSLGFSSRILPTFLVTGIVPIYQFVASGLLGKEAFSGGLGSAGLGLAIHFLIAFAAAGVYTVAARRWKLLIQKWPVCSLTYGVLVYLVMNYAIIPLSRIEPSPFSLPLFLNGVFGHALLVGLPIGFFASRLRD